VRIQNEFLLIWIAPSENSGFGSGSSSRFGLDRDPIHDQSENPNFVLILTNILLKCKNVINFLWALRFCFQLLEKEDKLYHLNHKQGKILLLYSSNSKNTSTRSVSGKQFWIFKRGSIDSGIKSWSFLLSEYSSKYSTERVGDSKPSVNDCRKKSEQNATETMDAKLYRSL